MEIVPYDRPRGTIHSIAALSLLSAERTNLLCISDRTFYILQNLAALDVEFQARYAAQLLENGYLPVEAGTPEFIIYQDAVESLQLELVDMSCDIVASLAEIRDAIQSISLAQSQAATVCCSYTFDPASYYEADPGTGSPALKCDLSWSYALYWAQGTKEMYHQWVMGAFPAVGVLAAILDEFDLPGQIILEIVTFGASSALPYLESAWAAIVDSLVEGVACAIFNAPGSATAKADIFALIDAVPDLHPTAATLLKSPVSHEGLNKVYDGTFPISPGTFFCGQCQSFEGAFAQTSFFSPFNQLVIGDSIEFDLEDGANGYRSQNSGQSLDIYFTLSELVDTWHFEAEVFPVSAGDANPGMIIQQFSGGNWFNLSTQYNWPATPGQAWTSITIESDDNLPAAVPLRVHLGLQDFNEYIWFRKVLLSSPGSP